MVYIHTFCLPVWYINFSPNCSTYNLIKFLFKIVSKEPAKVNTIKRRRVEPFTCSDFPEQEFGQTGPMTMVSERALLTPMSTTKELIRNQVKTEIELVRLQDQIGGLLRRIPVIEMDGILEEVFTIDVDDVEYHAYDERFAALFGLGH